MKKLILTMAVIFCGAMITEAQTVHDPNVVPTITPKQIKELGQQHQKFPSSVIVLDFEGLGDLDDINGFYNGGISGAGYSGTNYGIEFSVALGLIDSDAGGSGNFANEPSPSTVMFFTSASQAQMNVAAGFTTGFSVFYCSSVTGSIEVYDGLDGTGNLVGSVSLTPNVGSCTGDPNGSYCQWDPVAVPFSGTARSVVFIGAADLIAFDDVTFGSITPGPTPGVPISNWAIFIGLFLIGAFMVVRFRRTLA
ncbi:MAG: PEP-CTERM sorting domain-containing protein [Bacteroidetes bacterium HGW-Bacteroidetes-16]|jgi:hypothetical protein|nr:MAG: PEP-CTERM sorting domain-containing protein [Bacteroidetes bacterium HGW-Bacteroidetes-16]